MDAIRTINAAVYDFVFRSHELECTRRFAAKSYGRYLLLKVCKSIAAGPYLLVWLTFVAFFGLYKLGELLAELTMLVLGLVAVFFVESRWFTGYSYRHWRKVHRPPFIVPQPDQPTSTDPSMGQGVGPQPQERERP